MLTDHMRQRFRLLQTLKHLTLLTMSALLIMGPHRRTGMTNIILATSTWTTNPRRDAFEHFIITTVNPNDLNHGAHPMAQFLWMSHMTLQLLDDDSTPYVAFKMQLQDAMRTVATAMLHPVGGHALHHVLNTLMHSVNAVGNDLYLMYRLATQDVNNMRNMFFDQTPGSHHTQQVMYYLWMHDRSGMHRP